jgi:alkanesulfonate monooxygenase SsuD/methylene tetrahydromethanopterin reductase-like flavin-dependent oxidoreductase (luciferase family)
MQTRVPIIVGGKGERRTLPIVARWCDGWNYSRGTPEEFAAKRQLLLDMCAADGRDTDELRASVQVRVDHRDVGPGRDLAFAYADAGATDIVLYAQAIPAAVGPLAGVADELAAARPG